MKQLFTSWLPYFSLLGLSAALVVTGCSNISSNTGPHNQSPNIPPITSNQGSINNPFVKCPPYNPEKTMCTAQYDPVCVTVKNTSGVSYRTAGNACSACATTEALGFVKGECQ